MTGGGPTEGCLELGYMVGDRPGAADGAWRSGNVGADTIGCARSGSRLTRLASRQEPLHGRGDGDDHRAAHRHRLRPLLHWIRHVPTMDKRPAYRLGLGFSSRADRSRGNRQASLFAACPKEIASFERTLHFVTPGRRQLQSNRAMKPKSMCGCMWQWKRLRPG